MGYKIIFIENHKVSAFLTPKKVEKISKNIKFNLQPYFNMEKNLKG
jgi:hypothetical protein